MTNNQLTDEELQTLIVELQQTAYRLNGTNSAYLMSDAIKPLRELQERRKAAMDSEPVADVVAWSHPTEERTCDIRWRRHDVEPGPLYRHAQQSVVPDYPETLPCPVLLEPGMRFGTGVKTRLVLDAIQRRAEHYAELEAMTPEERAEHDANIEAFKIMLNGGR